MEELVRYFYRTEKNRRFVVAYVHDRETGVAKYGAAVFRQDRPNESFQKKNLRETAKRRLQINPVKLTFVVDKHLSELEDRIREEIRVSGVRGKERLLEA